MTYRAAAALALALAIALPLAGCGRKSNLIPPPGSQYPGTYPAVDFPGDPAAPAVEAPAIEAPAGEAAPARPSPPPVVAPPRFEDMRRPGAP